jgi:hypothetical protein
MKIGQPRRRSEEIRRKLTQESQHNIRRASRRLVEPSAALQNNSAIQADFDTRENTASAIRVRFRPSWRILSLGLCGLLAYTLVNIWQSPRFVIKEVEVLGLQRIQPAEVITSAGIEGKHVLSMDNNRIKEIILAAYPEIRLLGIQVDFPAMVTISAVERQPIISWRNQDQLIWIDGEGYLIPARGEASIPLEIQSNSLPAYSLEVLPEELAVTKTVRDKESYLPGIPQQNFFTIPKRVNDDLLTAILQLNAWMPKEKTLLHQAERGMGWQDARGWEVFVGQKLENINDKMVMYQMIVRELERQEINPTLVSVEFLNAPYYRTGE